MNSMTFWTRTDLSDLFNTDVTFINDRMDAEDVSVDRVHPSVNHGIPKIVETLQFYIHQSVFKLEMKYFQEMY